jgi:predicted GNAT superfamily acetyltransferase
MAQGTRRKRRDEIKLTIAPFQSQTDYKSAVDIQREVWKFDDIDIIPPSMLLASDRSGGISLGAYNTIGEMVGFVSSFLGTEEGILIQHSHMLAVRQAYRNFGVGYRLKLAQRKESLKRKIRRITWTFDPVQPLNAYFNLGKLGARSSVYAENFYGESSSVLHRGLPTDRLLARWDLDSSATVKRLETGAPRHELRKELKKLEVINRLEDVSPGMTTSSPVKLTSTADQLLFEVPYNLPTIKVRDLGVALEWQGKMRQVFRAYFKKGYVASDFWVGEEEGHLRAFYYLEKGRR